MISRVTVLSLASHAPSVLGCLLPHDPIVLVVFFHTIQVFFFHTIQSSWLSSSIRSRRPGCLLPHDPVVLVVFFHTIQSSWLSSSTHSSRTELSSSTHSSRTDLFCCTHSLRPGIVLGCPDNHILTSLSRFVGHSHFRLG